MSERNPEHVRLNDVAAIQHLSIALAQYADPKNWAIRRDGHQYPAAVWIGPGATERVPNAPGIARDALERVHGQRARG